MSRVEPAHNTRILVEYHSAFDMRPAAGATLADLDLDFVRKQLNAPAPEYDARSLERQLRSLRLVRGGQPTWGALLAFGRDPQAFLPGAYFRFLLAELMASLGFASRVGRGLPLAREAMTGNGNPPPEYRFERSLIVGVLRIAP